MAATPQAQGRVLRAAGTFDFLLAIGLLLSPRLGFHLDPFVVNVAAALLLIGAVSTILVARRVERLAEAGQRAELPGQGGR